MYNAIVLRNPMIENKKERNQTVFYDIRSYGKHVHYREKGQFINLLPQNTKKNTTFFLLDTSDVTNLNIISIYEENWKMNWNKR